MKQIAKLVVSVLLILFLCCVFGAFYEGSIDISTWDEETKSGVLSGTVLITFFIIFANSN